MREATGNLWNLVQPAEALVITTNGTVTMRGRGVMGRGIALETKQRWPNMDRALGDHLVREGNHVWCWMSTSTTDPLFDLVFMPVKHQWHQPADPKLIIRSANELASVADDHSWQTVWMPRPGCGNGRLNWALVKPLIEGILDDRFIAVTFEGSDG